jgi:DNA-binding NtrC family response regulator
VHGIVAQSGGQLHVDSAPGAGSTFVVYLPRVRDAEAFEGAAAPTPGVLSGSETVLLVEDDDGVRSLAELLLSEAGYSVLSAAGGEEALGLAERHPGQIDLLLSDVVMPGLGGVALAEAVERLRPGIRVLYMSGYPGEDLVGVTSSTGLVPKPFTLETLLEPVRHALDAVAPSRGSAAATSL